MENLLGITASSFDYNRQAKRQEVSLSVLIPRAGQREHLIVALPIAGTHGLWLYRYSTYSKYLINHINTHFSKLS